MATIEDRIAKRQIQCLFCGSVVPEATLGRTGLDKEELRILKRRIKNVRFGPVLRLIDEVLTKAESGELGPDLEFSVQLGEIQKGQLILAAEVSDIKQKLSVPTGKGDAGEIITIRDLKSMHPLDDFSEEKAPKKGTDIVATVKENQRSWGTVAVSVKYQDQWSSKFLDQIRKNMEQEGTSFALLVTEKFPRDALNDKGYEKSNKPGEILWIVKPEYAVFAYGCLRYALIAATKATSVIKAQTERVRAQEQIAKAIKEWINGDGFQKTTNRIDEAINCSKETTDELDNIKSYFATKVNNLKEKQAKLRECLGIAKDTLEDLKKFLQGRKLEDGN